MFFNASTSLSVLLAFSAAYSVSAHGVVTNIKGANGKNGVGFGVTDVTGKKVSLFDQASRFLKGNNAECGSQKLNGKAETAVNEQSELSKAINAGLPTAASDGTISMTLFQVNADGAGPYNCEVSDDASGGNFVAMKTVTDVPGTKGISNAKNTAFPLDIQLPANTKCSGPCGACLVRCKNAVNEPFGGCLAVAQGAAKRDSVARLISEARFHEDAALSRDIQDSEDSEDLEDIENDDDLD